MASVSSPLSYAAEGDADESAAQHVRDGLTSDMLANFGLFLYIDKSETGPFAQTMYVFQKTDAGDIVLLHKWPVSSGRDDIEADAHGRARSTSTPRGYFELDPKRMFEDHISAQWNEAMPYAMFFDWAPKGHPTGLAIHGAPDDRNELGSPASAGCIRLSISHAETLFSLVQSQFRGAVPRLAYLDGDTGVSSEGLFLHDKDGNLQMADGYSVLVLIDGFTGSDQVSSLMGE